MRYVSGRRRLVAVLATGAVLAAFVGALAAAPQAGWAQDEGALRGTVVGPSNEPVGGAPVTLFDGTTGVELTSTTTTVDGSYAFTALALGTYKVRVTPTAPYAPQWFDAQPTWEAATPVTLTEAARDGVAEVHVLLAGRITGTATGDGGVPVADAIVLAYPSSGWWPSLPQAFTGPDGVYTLEGLSPLGSYRVVAYDRSGAGYLPAVYRDRPSVGSDVYDPVTVPSGGTTPGIDIRFVHSPIVEGRITGPSGEPVGGADVSFTASSGGSTSATTGPDGWYGTSSLWPQTYTVDIRPPTGSRYAPAQRTVSPGSGERVRLDVQLELLPTGTMTGRLLGPDGQPITDGAYVRAIPVEGGDVVAGYPDAQGRYVIAGLTPGLYRAVFDEYGGRGYRQIWYQQKPDWSSADTFLVRSGEVTSDVDVQFMAPAAVSGRVTDQQGNGVSGVSITLTGPYGQTGWAYTYWDGTYTASNLWPGDYQVTFQPDPNHVGTTATVTVVAGQIANLDVVLRKLGSIAGVVTGPLGEPLANVAVHVFGPTSRDAWTDWSGRYSIGALDDGVYRVQFEYNAAQYAFAWWNDRPTSDSATPVTIVGGADTTGIDAVLYPLGVVEGHVRGPSGEPVVGVTTRFSGPNGFVRSGMDSGTDGAYGVGGLWRGAYTVTFDPGPLSPYLPATVAVTAISGSRVTLDATLVLSGGVSGTVTAKRPLQPGEVTVNVLTSDGRPVAAASVATDGAYAVSHLVPGRYVVQYAPRAGSTLEPVYFDKAKTLSKATLVTVRGGRTTVSIDAALKGK